MTPDRDSSEQITRERRLREMANEAERRRGAVASQEEGEDWPLLSALFGGLAVALLVNTFVSLMPA